MTTYQRWYRTGTASVTNGSTAVTGALTAWLADIRPGDGFSLDGTRWVEIASVESNTALTLASAWGGSTAAGSAYMIDRRSVLRQLAADLGARTSSLLDTIRALPALLVATVSGGTANAIQATTTTALPSGDVTIILVPSADNTGAATLSVNGDTAIPIQTNAGAAIAAGALKANVGATLTRTSGAWRLPAPGVVASVAGRTGDVVLAAADVADTTTTGRALMTTASASAARSTLGLVIGTNVQAYAANLTSWAALAPTAKADTAHVHVANDISNATTAGKALLTAADVAAQRTALGLAVGTDVQAYAANLTSWAGIAPAAKADTVDDAEADIAGAITWTGTAPSGTATLRCRWSRVGKMVFVEIRMEYATAGASNTSVDVTLPAGLPAPSDFSGFTDGEALFAAAGYFYQTLTGDAVASRAWVYKSGSAYKLKIVSASITARLVTASFFYRAA